MTYPMQASSQPGRWFCGRKLTRPIQFEITEKTREAITELLKYSFLEKNVAVALGSQTEHALYTNVMCKKHEPIRSMSSNLQLPDFTEDFVSFMVQMYLTVARFPLAPYALIPLSKAGERFYGADAIIESISPLYLQFKRSNAYPEFSTAKYISDRKKLGLSCDPRVLYFDLRRKKKNHMELQHNVLFKLRSELRNEGVGEAIYVAPLFLNRTAYLLSVHLSGLLHWSPWHHEYPFPHRTQQVISSSGIIRFQNIPTLKEHISIPPHASVSTHKHRYSFMESGGDLCFHSPEAIGRGKTLGQFVYEFMRYSEGGPSTEMIQLNESRQLLNRLSDTTFSEESIYNTDQSPIEQWFDFGQRLRSEFEIEQYVLVKYKNT